MPATEMLPAAIREKMPKSHKIWWIRGEVLAVRPIFQNNQAARNGRYLQGYEIEIMDRDEVSCVYAFTVEKHYWSDFIEGDFVSIFGHEKQEATDISRIRLYVNHHTRDYGRTFQEVGGILARFLEGFLDQNFRFRTNLAVWEVSSYVEPVYREALNHVLSLGDHEGNYRPVSTRQGKIA